MIEVWFGLVVSTLGLYAVLDGWNIGAGVLHFVVARTADERRDVVRALTPVWSWHEVWLIVAGGTLFVAFPAALATTLSGFYLAVFVLLWSLAWRGLSLELVDHVDDPMWRSFWDTSFAGSSVALAVLLGVGAGNLVRGVPLDAAGRFSLSFFTDFKTSGTVGLLDWYTLSVAAFTLLCLAAHGAAYLARQAEGAAQERSARLARRLWPLALGSLVPLTAETAWLRPDLFRHMTERPSAWVGVTIAAGGAVVLARDRSRSDTAVFLAGCAVIAGILEAGAAALFPILLYSTNRTSPLSAFAAATARPGLRLALFWWPAAVALSIAYVGFVMRYYVRPSAPTTARTRSGSSSAR